MDSTHCHSNVGVKNNQDAFIDFDYVGQSLNSFRLGMPDSYFKGRNLDYDEIDLLSECSTPVSYVPGKYLQLCDISPVVEREVLLWPVSSGHSLSEGNITSLLPGTAQQVGEKEGYRYPQTFRKTSGLTQTRSSLVITIGVCVVMAVTALCGLASFV